MGFRAIPPPQSNFLPAPAGGSVSAESGRLLGLRWSLSPTLKSWANFSVGCLSSKTLNCMRAGMLKKDPDPLLILACF